VTDRIQHQVFDIAGRRMPLHHHRRLSKRWNELPRNDDVGKEFSISSTALGGSSDSAEVLERRPSARRFVKSIWNTVTNNSPDRSSQLGDASRFDSGGSEQEGGATGGGAEAVSGLAGQPLAPNDNGGPNHQDEEEEAVETEEFSQLSKPELSAEVGTLRMEVERQELLMERQQLVKKLEAMKREAAAAAAASTNDAATTTTTAEGSLLQQKEELTSKLVTSLLLLYLLFRFPSVLTSDDAPPPTHIHNYLLESSGDSESV